VGDSDSTFLVVILGRPKVEKAEAGRIAVVIDDFGDRHDPMVEAFLSLDAPITFSILPGRKYSARIAGESIQKGHEVILHLIMEPLNEPFKDDGNMVLKGMPPSQIREIVERSSKEVSGDRREQPHGIESHPGQADDGARFSAPRRTRPFFHGQLHHRVERGVSPRARDGAAHGEEDVFLDVSTAGGHPAIAGTRGSWDNGAMKRHRHPSRAPGGDSGNPGQVPVCQRNLRANDTRIPER
jgi:hypothetical protein